MSSKKILWWMFIFTLVSLLLTGCGAQSLPSEVLSTETINKQATAPTVPTAIPTPAPIEVAPGEFIPASQIVGFEARDTSGKLIYVEDINGKWIRTSYEIVVPPATAEDWAAVNNRLGAEFAINPDGTITGIEGLNIDMASGKAVFNFDGKGIETYHIQNIKVQEVDGEKRLLVAGYMWNGEMKSWEVFNPGFPMESPEAQLGWFVQADVANGNWLRFHQRALEALAEQGGFASVDEYMKELFKNAMRPDQWYAAELLIDNQDLNSDGTKDILHTRQLVWTSGTFNSSLPVSQKGIIKKDQYPWCSLSYGFLANAGTILISFDVLNGDESTTSMPMVLDDVLWTKFRDTSGFARAALASGHEWDESMAHPGAFKHSNDPEGWIFGLIINNLPDSTMTNSMGERDVAITKEQEAAQRREETIVGDKVAQAAGLEIWGAVVLGNYHEE